MAGANHDYGGHRVKAMHAVHGAYGILDKEINKVGTPQQKAASKQGDALAEAAREAAKKTPVVHENQGASDVQMAQASEILAQLRAVFHQAQRKHLLEHVNRALDEIQRAFEYRKSHGG